MNANPIWRTLETFEKVLSPTPKDEKLYIVHEDGMKHLEEDCRELEHKNANLMWEIKRLRDAEERLREKNDLLAEFNEQLVEENMKLKAHNGRLPFNALACECRFERPFSKDEAWRGHVDVYCMHRDNFDQECDATDFAMYPLVEPGCPKVREYLQNREEE